MVSLDCNGRTLKYGDIVEPVGAVYRGGNYKVEIFIGKHLRVRNLDTGNLVYRLSDQVRKLEPEELI